VTFAKHRSLVCVLSRLQIAGVWDVFLTELAAWVPKVSAPTAAKPALSAKLSAAASLLSAARRGSSSGAGRGAGAGATSDSWLVAGMNGHASQHATMVSLGALMRLVQALCDAAPVTEHNRGLLERSTRRVGSVALHPVLQVWSRASSGSASATLHPVARELACHALDLLTSCIALRVDAIVAANDVARPGDAGTLPLLHTPLESGLLAPLEATGEVDLDAVLNAKGAFVACMLCCLCGRVGGWVGW